MTAQRAWTDEELGFIQAPPRGWTNSDIATYLGRTRGTVSTYRSKLAKGWAPQLSDSRSDEFLQTIAASFDQVVADVAAELGCSKNVVVKARVYLRKNGTLAESSKQSWRPRPKPFQVGQRTLLAKTCVDCGLLWGGAHFGKNTKGRYSDRCHRCHGRRYGRESNDKGAARMSAYRSAMEIATQKMSTRSKSYRSNSGQPWTEADVALLRRCDLTLVEVASSLGRSWKAAHSAAYAYGVKRPRERATQLPTGEWHISFQHEDIAAAA